MASIRKVPRFRRISRWLLRALGWSLHTEFPDARKYVLIVAPHTSNWDFPLGILAARALGLDARWLGKHTLFRRPFGWFFRALGGIPVQRDRSQHLIDAIGELFGQSDELIIALAPEGTRSKTEHWKSGFYHVARSAGVPIVMASLDYGAKRIAVGGSFLPGDDIEAVFERIRQFYAGCLGRCPEKQGEIRPRTA